MPAGIFAAQWTPGPHIYGPWKITFAKPTRASFGTSALFVILQETISTRSLSMNYKNIKVARVPRKRWTWKKKSFCLHCQKSMFERYLNGNLKSVVNHNLYSVQNVKKCTNATKSLRPIFQIVKSKFNFWRFVRVIMYLNETKWTIHMLALRRYRPCLLSVTYARNVGSSKGSMNRETTYPRSIKVDFTSAKTLIRLISNLVQSQHFEIKAMICAPTVKRTQPVSAQVQFFQRNLI